MNRLNQYYFKESRLRIKASEEKDEKKKEELLREADRVHGKLILRQKEKVLKG